MDDEFLRRVFPVCLPSDGGDYSREGELPRVHLDDPDARHHFIHDADSVVGQHCRFAPGENQSIAESMNVKQGNWTIVWFPLLTWTHALKLM